MSGNELLLSKRDGELYLDTAPVPEQVTIYRELWNTFEIHDPEAEDFAPPPAWLEVVKHAGAEVKDHDGNVLVPDRDTDGYVLHVDATNAFVSYRVAAVPEEGPITGVLGSWGER